MADWGWPVSLLAMSARLRPGSYDRELQSYASDEIYDFQTGKENITMRNTMKYAVPRLTTENPASWSQAMDLPPKVVE